MAVDTSVSQKQENALKSMLYVPRFVMRLSALDPFDTPYAMRKRWLGRAIARDALAGLLFLVVIVGTSYTAVIYAYAALRHMDKLETFLHKLCVSAAEVEKLLFLFLWIYKTQFRSTIHTFLNNKKTAKYITFDKRFARKITLLLFIAIGISMAISAVYAFIIIKYDSSDKLNTNATFFAGKTWRPEYANDWFIWFQLFNYTYATIILLAISAFVYGSITAITVAIGKLKSNFRRQTGKEHVSTGELKRLILDHMELCELANMVDKMSRSLLFVAIVFGMPFCMVNVWFIIKMRNAMAMVLMCKALVVALTLYPMLWAAATLSEELASFGGFLLSTQNGRPPWDDREQSALITDYIIRLGANVHGIECYGFFTVTKSFLLTVSLQFTACNASTGAINLFRAAVFRWSQHARAIATNMKHII